MCDLSGSVTYATYNDLARDELSGVAFGLCASKVLATHLEGVGPGAEEVLVNGLKRMSRVERVSWVGEK